MSMIDDKWMRRALALARKGKGRVHPNPMVGAVLVKNGRLIGEGYHRFYGGDHAETHAIRQAGSRARGSTLYVTLEPCAHWGKTPPCAHAVAQAGIRRIVVAMKDPNPLVAGKGFKILRQAKIACSIGTLQKEATELNHIFVTRMRTGRPYVTLKIACSLDGRTHTVCGESKWITSPASREAGHRLRSHVDAIAVGAGTVLQDNPTLTSHGKGRNPLRVVFAGRRKLSKRLNVFNQAAETLVIQNAAGPANLLKSLKDLGAKNISHLLVEGGETLHRSFLEAGVVDEIYAVVAPVIIGQEKQLKNAWRVRGAKDVIFTGRLVR
jgi:diaminohydroxyphosphoribosylaminopyrimidine deaminase / 5-amino-6-(5-phosphoribosylamino)uracil reductase